MLTSSIGQSDIMTSFEGVILIDAIFQQAQEFLNHKNNSRYNLLNVFRKFQDLKKSCYYWKLSRRYSLEYYTDLFFESRLNLLLTDGKTQLSLKLWSQVGIWDVSALGNVHALDLSNCSGISDLSALGTVHTLNISRCGGIRDVSALGEYGLHKNKGR
jgi:hypothetical protein